MGIATESNIPNLVLQLNAIQKQINYRGIIREITDSYWKDEIGPRLYPDWDTDKDKLVQLNYYDDGSFLARRRKFIKDFSTNEYYWKDYEMEVYNSDEAKELFELLKEAFYLIESVEKENFQKELAEAYYRANEISWFGIRLVRNFLLEDSDWVFIGDSQVSDEDKELWKVYRQALRDVPQVDEYVEPDDVKFPISPQDWKTFYRLENPTEKYLETQNQYLKLSGYFISHYKEKVVQYLLIKQSVMSPLNYKSYAERMSSLPVFEAPAISQEELGKLLKSIPELPSEQDSENFIDNLIQSLSENTEG